MAILSLQDVSISFGGLPLLENMNMQVEKGERICLLGRNGEGKTTILRLIGGVIEPDGGLITSQKGISITGLDQDLPPGISGTVFDVVAGGLSGIGAMLEEYHHLAAALKHDADGAILRRMDSLHDRIEREKGWQTNRQIETILTRLSIDPDISFETLSVGFKRRVLFARALVAEPDILLLDEPTNHLDIGSITWMEDYLLKYRGTIIFVTHDRRFLQRLATRIVEIDRGRLFSWACGYSAFLERREAALEAEQSQKDLFMKKLAREEQWIRKGVKARRTRNEGRVRALLKMREEQQGWRKQLGAARIIIQESDATGKVVIDAEGIRHGYNGATLINNLSTRIIRGDRIGIIGPNGIGKSTLLGILLGRIVPDKGRVRMGTRMEIVYFDQLREQLNEDMSVQENIAEGKDFIDINGSRCHVIGYLKDFLFSPDRARSPVRVLSGGERNRLLLARLFTRPSNVLVLDEPTNDLDMETLELLEDRLINYSGTILLVSHDREFLNNVVTSTLVFEGNGVVNEYPGGYDDWLSQRPAPVEEQIERPARKSAAIAREDKKDKPRRLTFKEKGELEGLPAIIENLEQEQKAIYAQMAEPGFYKGPADS
ncbi:MAG: ATP-binding cassette domain-containing protein, partial [Deltaproteobacteria bacterium]|nr:ATP-binding cassette domain-containing protein [Deltaproteobacteria bacterium]